MGRLQNGAQNDDAVARIQLDGSDGTPPTPAEPQNP